MEITGKDLGQIEAAKSEIPAGTPINIAFLGNETHAQRIEAAARIRQWGFEPVPIISSRRLTSVQDRDELLAGLTSARDLPVSCSWAAIRRRRPVLTGIRST
ncbi:hypothetical protein [Ensifer canadensis]